MASFKSSLPIYFLCLATLPLQFYAVALTAVIPRDSPKSSILVEVGKSSFDIGDQDATTFQAKYMEPECDNMGCDSGSPQSFQFVTDSGGTTDQGTATIQMSGYINNDSSIRQILLSSINTAMLHTGQCSKVSATKCIGDPAPLNPNPSKRESGPVALDCGDVSFGHCTIANYIQATLYGNDSSVKAQMTFQGSSVEPQGFDCGSFLGGIQDALGAIPLGNIGDTAGEVINGITAICHLIGI